MAGDEIGFLILAHDNPAALRRLCARLAAPWSHVFIHIDARGTFSRW